MQLTHRIATRGDLPVLMSLMRRSIDELQTQFLNAEQIKGSHHIMGVDTQLIDDQTYFVIESENNIVGCGGWSRRNTVYGGDHSPGRDSALLDPSRDAARVRAMYTHPDFTRRGVGRLILKLCESAARADGFTKLWLVGTLAGQPLYENAGFEVVESFEDSTSGTTIPLVKMTKEINSK